ncbi:MAG: hypothetical protein ACRDHM_03745 [Actinomycetota bacterium]
MSGEWSEHDTPDDERKRSRLFVVGARHGVGNEAEVGHDFLTAAYDT